VSGPAERKFLLAKMNELFGHFWLQTDASMTVVFESFTGGEVFRQSGSLAAASVSTSTSTSRSGSTMSPREDVRAGPV
jgi:hypothetical protein